MNSVVFQWLSFDGIINVKFIIQTFTYISENISIISAAVYLLSSNFPTLLQTFLMLGTSAKLILKPKWQITKVKAMSVVGISTYCCFGQTLQ